MDSNQFRAMAVVICLIVSYAAAADCVDANIEAAFGRQDIPALRHIIDEGLAQPALDPIEAAVLGLAAYRESILLNRNSQGSEAQALIARVTDGIDPIRTRTRDPDVTAILSMLYGLEIELSPIRGFYLGRRIQDILDAAQTGGIPNPRLRLAQGLSVLYRPKLFGGGPQNAISSLDAAIAGLDPTLQQESCICWGLTDAMLALARARIALHERPIAITLVDDAIARDPQNPMAQWMRDELARGSDGGH
jgi:hypothetical protein